MDWCGLISQSLNHYLKVFSERIPRILAVKGSNLLLALKIDRRRLDNHLEGISIYEVIIRDFLLKIEDIVFVAGLVPSSVIAYEAGIERINLRSISDFVRLVCGKRFLNSEIGKANFAPGCQRQLAGKCFSFPGCEDAPCGSTGRFTTEATEVCSRILIVNAITKVLSSMSFPI